MKYEFDMESFIEFMMIQSNVNVKTEGEGKNIDEISIRFHNTLGNVFTRSKETALFKGYSGICTKDNFEPDLDILPISIIISLWEKQVKSSFPKRSVRDLPDLKQN